MSRQIVIRLERKKAIKLFEALSNRTFDKLTKARADALDDFMLDLSCEIEMAEYDSRDGEPNLSGGR